MSDNYDPFPDLALLLGAALRAERDGSAYAERIAERLELDPDGSPAVLEKALREALGPRSAAEDGELRVRIHRYLKDHPGVAARALAWEFRESAERILSILAAMEEDGEACGDETDPRAAAWWAT